MPWTPQEVAAARSALGLRQADLGRLGETITGRPLAGERTVNRWENEGVPATVELLLELLLRSHEMRRICGLQLLPERLLPAQRRRLGIAIRA